MAREKEFGGCRKKPLLVQGREDRRHSGIFARIPNKGLEGFQEDRKGKLTRRVESFWVA